MRVSPAVGDDDDEQQQQVLTSSVSRLRTSNLGVVASRSRQVVIRGSCVLAGLGKKVTASKRELKRGGIDYFSCAAS